MNLKLKTNDLSDWQKMIDNICSSKEPLKIALAGKYTELDDAYISVIEAIKSACFSQQRKLELEWIDTELLEKPETKNEVMERIESCAGIVVPGGFGKRGIEGKIAVAKYCRENNVPFFGLCLGSQVMAIEFARHVCGLEDANSEEFNPNAQDLIVHFMPDQNEERAKGGTLRLGAYPCVIDKNTKAYAAYGSTEISERHRHRYEFNNKYRDVLTKNGFVIAGTSPDERLVEIVEIKDHKWMLGVQFHPEFLSRPNRPHPLFKAFIEACLQN